MEQESFGTQKKDGKIVFDKLEKISHLSLFTKKPVVPFKNILLPDKQEIKKLDPKRSIALIGLANCDLWAFTFFLKEFEHTDLLPKRENFLIVGSECVPDHNCFCEKMGMDAFAPFDLFIQEEGDKYSIFSGTKKGEEILKKTGVKLGKRRPKLIPIREKTEKFRLNDLSGIIENRASSEDFWQGIANNCFGCGACTAVCPLCFCTRQEFENDICGKSNQCLKWDSCFAKRFSEIQNRHDLRPENVDRLYNWYHHKFVRAKSQNGHFLCTGCGRCIEACPAGLNIKNILEVIINKDEDKNPG